MKNSLILSLLTLVFMVTGVFGQNARTYFRTGEDFVSVGNYKDAVDQFTKAIELQPDLDKAYIARAEAYEKLGMKKEAATDYDRASTFLAKKPDVFFQAGRLYYELGEYETSIKRLDKSISIKRNNVEPYQVKSQVLIALERYEEALSICNTALSLKETDITLFNRGVVNERIGQYEAAEQDFLRAISKNRLNIDVLLALAELRLNMDKLQFALTNVDKAIQLDPDNRRAYLIRSRIYVKQLDYPKAINDISKNILLNPDDEQMYFIRGTYYQEFTQHPNAINDFTKVLMLNDQNAEAYYMRAWSYEQIANYEKAIEDYMAMIALSEYDVRAQKLLKSAEERLFELNREANKPEIVINNPEPKEKDVIRFPKGSKIVNIKGQIVDESDVKYLKINGLEMPAVEKEGRIEFLAALDIESLEHITFEVSDVYDNVQVCEYTILLTEVDPPVVRIIAPYASDNGEIYLDSNDPNVYVEGNIEDESLIESIIINGALASYIPDQINPTFSASLNIQNKNEIVVTAIDVYDNETVAEFRLNREAAIISENNPMGKTWAVFIENSIYQTFASLDGPTKDVSLMKAALAKYQIHNIIHKKDMTKKDMEKFFSIELRDLVRSNRVNSIMIWYAGHGKFINETGYWIPVDASRDDEFTYFNINALKASLQSYANYITHTLIITDACESGPSFYQAMRSELTVKSCDDWQATKFKSSQVFSSAGYELAVDNSQFTRTFANSLANNPDACIPIESIVTNVTRAMVNNKQQKPQFGKIDGLEDENGTFFFITKGY